MGVHGGNSKEGGPLDLITVFHGLRMATGSRPVHRQTLNTHTMVDTMPLFAAGAAAFFAICYILTLVTNK